MKKIFLTIMLSLFCTAVFSAPVSPETARTVAVNFWKMKTGADNKLFLEITGQLGVENMYVFVTKDNDGFVIVAADNVAIPILGYSLSNGIRSDEELPYNTSRWLNHYADEIKTLAAANHTPDAATTGKWEVLLTGTATPKAPSGAKSVAPLVTTKWDQSDPYNKKCPIDKDGNVNRRSVTGCVATSMSQVMKYWDWPIKGSGSNTYTCTSLSANAPTRVVSASFDTVYQWENMPDGGLSSNGYTNLASGWTTAQKNAVALLLFHCGVSVNMQYRYTMSSAIQSYVPQALKGYFYYGGAVYRQKSQYSDSNWKNLVKDEIDAGRPMVYGGAAEDGSDGHSFVCDGYDDDENFHFNWGWSGSSDGYFPLSSLNPGSGGIGSTGYNFTYYQDAVFGIAPGIQTNQIFQINNADNTVEMLSRLTGSCGFRNISSKTFSGYLGVAAYDDNGDFVTVLAKTGNINLNANSTKTLNINYTAAAPIVAGHYTAKAACSVDGINWKPIVVGYNDCPTEVEFTVTGVAYTVNVVSDDESKGTVSGGGQFLLGSTAEFSATPRDGFRFTNWNDGNTENQRTESVTGDATYTAYFEIDPTYEYTIRVVSDNPEMGTTSGGGQYVYGSTAVISATPKPRYRFVNWDDGETESTRSITVTESKTFTAFFEDDPLSIDDVVTGNVRIFPNPTSGVLRVDVDALQSIDVIDAIGRTVLHVTGSNSVDMSALDNGIYTLRITAGDDICVKKVAKK